MMTISLSEVSKRFNRDWIFRKFSYTFTAPNSYAITGPNGSGKSTLLQVIGGAIAMSEGEIGYLVGSRESGVRRRISSTTENSESSIQNSEFRIQNSASSISPDLAFKYISIAAPYLDVIEEMTAIEFLDFHRKFKPLLKQFSIQQVLDVVGLQTAANKLIRYYSSGMKQRIKLAQAVFSDTPVVLLDEPTTNLDEEGIRLYHQLISEHCANRLVIVSSNDSNEYGFCKERISILDYK